MIKLTDISTRPPKGLSKKEIEEKTKKYAKQIADFHALIRAEKKYAILIIFQGMDASGKDGAVKNVLKYCTHDGISVYSFKKPTEKEFAHDFLWRVHKQCPGKGEIKVFNRSHYEDVLIQRVHKWIDEEKVDKRMDAINSFEDLIQFDNNTILFKFFLHLSYDQQEIELQQRIDERDKNWKHNSNDWREREHWEEYMRCYEDVLNNCRTPWQIVPVDERWYRDYLISKAIVERLETLPMEWPSLEED
jgi:PPK2 family polyphosphate:nucleotide phosphotransferase